MGISGLEKTMPLPIPIFEKAKTILLAELLAPSRGKWKNKPERLKSLDVEIDAFVGMGR
jgi:hypothetical protein